MAKNLKLLPSEFVFLQLGVETMVINPGHISNFLETDAYQKPGKSINLI